MKVDLEFACEFGILLDAVLFVDGNLDLAVIFLFFLPSGDGGTFFILVGHSFPVQIHILIFPFPDFLNYSF